MKKLALRKRRKHRKSKPKHQRRLTQQWLGRTAAVLLTLIAASLLYLGNRWQFSHDLSASGRHSLTEQSVRTVESFDKPVRVTAVLGPNPEQREAVSALIDRYREHNEQLTLSFINPESQPGLARELNAAPGGELIIETGTDDSRREKRLQNLSERSFTEALTQLSRDGTRNIAFVSGHGERTTLRKTNSDFSVLAEELTAVGLNATEISLVTTPVVPDSVDLLVIAAPTSEYFPGEVATLLNFVGNGGNLLWLIDETHDTGLEALSSELGIQPLPGVLLDATSSAYGADTPTFAVVDHTSLPQHPVNQTVGNPLLLPAATALDVTPLAGQSTQPLFFSSDKSWTESGPVAGEVRFDANTTERRGPLLLGVALVRDTQRMTVIGDADWLASQWIGNGANLAYAERLFNWLAGDATQLAFATAQPDDALINPESKTILLMGGGFLFGLPLLFLGIAAFLWRRQQNG